MDRAFFSLWKDWYPDAPPLGFVLRETYPDLWLRIPGLPEGKRYAESDVERDELTRRHNAAATEVLRFNSDCVLVLFVPCTADSSVAKSAARLVGDTDLQLLGQLERRWQDEYFAEPMCFLGTRLRWTPGAYDGFIDAVGEGKARGLIVEMSLGRVYAPFAGGADLFFATPSERDTAADRFNTRGSEPSGNA